MYGIHNSCGGRVKVYIWKTYGYKYCFWSVDMMIKLLEDVSYAAFEGK